MAKWIVNWGDVRHAEFQRLGNGEVEVRFSSGETYLLAETTILRLA